MPAGPWKAKINLKSGLLDRNKQGTLTFPDGTSSSHLRLYILIAVIVLLALALLVVRYRRPRRTTTVGASHKGVGPPKAG